MHLMTTARTTPVFDATTIYNKESKDNYGKDDDGKDDGGEDDDGKDNDGKDYVG